MTGNDPKGERIENMKEKLEKLISDWHEAGRAAFEKKYNSLKYDSYHPKRVVEKTKYFYLDEGNSGAFIVDKATGTIWRLKSKYGVPNKKKVCGNVNTITGEHLDRLRWW